jgi:hypothetical protein
VVLCADTANVDTVIIGGKVHKRDGRLVADWQAARNRLQASTDHLVEAQARAKAEQPSA